jgi:hypothetical protein
MSWILGPVSLATGYFWGVFFAVELAGVAVTFIMIAFFVTAGHRLYRDLVEIAGQSASGATGIAIATATHQ